MARMKRHLLAIVLLLGIAGVACQKSNEDDNSQETDADNKLTISSKENVVKADDKLVVSCVFNGDLADPADLKWFDHKNRQIDGESNSRVFTISLAEHKTGHRKKNLHFSSLEASDSGTYTCVATDLDGKVHRAQSKIDVTPPVHWADTATVVGGLAGERLIINCGASGEPSPSIMIVSGSGEPLDESQFVIAGNEVTIPALTKEYDGREVSCMAMQIYEDRDTTLVSKKSVTIDVWFVPEFAAESIDRYAIIGRSAVLPCNTTASNPIPSTYTFYKNEEKIHDAERFSLVKHVLDHSAALTIKHVTIDDLGEYRCDVNNGKAIGSLTLHLKEANPPDEVKVSLETTSRHSMLWRVQADTTSELPVLRIDAEYLRKSLLRRGNDGEEDTTGEYDEPEENGVWEAQGNKFSRTKTDNNLYEITGLRMDTDYIFRFKAINEAGEGDMVEVTARTEGYEELSASSTHTAIFTILLSLLVASF
ncbi:unnamed protein product, partial [Mesorhabditis spiculigera]